MFLISTLLLVSCSSTLKVSDSDYPQKPNFQNLNSASERNKLFGTLKYKPWFGKGDITITNNWDKEHLEEVYISQLKGIKDSNGLPFDGNTKINKNILDQYKMLWHAWEKEGLLPLILTWDGGYVKRKIKGSYFVLSNHAYGTAFDINARENYLNEIPAKNGKKGNLYKLVPIANEHGFYWGGHFSRLDGMHFEVARVLSNAEMKVLIKKYN